MNQPIPLPPEVALAKAAEVIPHVDALRGGARYEPKFDGIRCAVTRDGVTRLWSRQRKELTDAFPELAAAAGVQLPDAAVFDGEIVAWAGGRLDFDALLRRINVSAGRGRMLARQTPANLVLFDVLALEGKDLRLHPFDERRRALEQVCSALAPPLSLSPVTEDEQVARQWFADLVDAGIEGLVVKAGAGSYRGGQRDWLKVKHRESVDVIIGAVIGSRRAPQAAVVGLVEGGKLRIAGRTAPLRREQGRNLAEALRPPAGAHPWPEEVTVGRFNRERSRVHLTLVEPVMGEVSADTARAGGAFRHLVRLEKVRPDLPVPRYDPTPRM